MTIILAFDPGAKTGWSIFDTRNDALLGAKEASGDVFLDKVVPWVDGYRHHPDAIEIVGERFIISGGTVTKGRTSENWSIEQIGVIRHHCRWAGVSFELQGAGDAKKFCDNTRLKLLGWHQRGGGGHHNDSLRHLLLYVARRHQDSFERLLTRI